MELEEAWALELKPGEVGLPAVVGGRFLTARGDRLRCLATASGKEQWTARLLRCRS